MELAVIQTDHVDDSFVPVADQDDSKQAVLAESVDSSSTVSVPCAAIDPPKLSRSTRSKAHGAEKFSAAKAFASALHSAQGSTFSVTGNAAENADPDERCSS